MLVYRKGDTVKKARLVGGFYGALAGVLLTGALWAVAPSITYIVPLLVPVGLIIGATVMGVDAAKMQQMPQPARMLRKDNL